MMRKFTFKSLFAAALLLVGTSSAWSAAGDVTTNVDIDFSNAITDSVVTGTKGSMKIGSGGALNDGHLQIGKSDNVVALDAAEYAGTKDIVTVSFDLAFGNLTGKNTWFYLYDKDGKEVGGLTASTYSGTLSSTIGLTAASQVQYAGKTSTPADWTARMNFVITFNYATKTITTVATKYAKDTAGTPVTYTAAMTNTNPIASFKVGSNYTTRWSQFDNLKIETTAGDYTKASANYTVKYVCDGTEVKDASTRTGDVASTPVLFSTDNANFFDANGVKYMYVSDDASTQTIAADGSTVVTVTLRKAATWTCTLVDDLGKTIKSGTGYEQETVKFAYPAYQLREGELYSTPATNKEYNTSIELTADSVSKTLTYTSAGVSNVVFLSEAEDISGLTACSNSNTSIRSSNSASAYAADGDVTITNLPVGKYKLTSVACDAAGKTASAVFSYLAGDSTIFTQTCANINWDSQTSDEFALNSATDIKLAKGGKASQGIDVIYIQKTDNVATSIKDVNTQKGIASGVMYNLNGQRIAAPQQGQLYIMGGKKFMIK